MVNSEGRLVRPRLRFERDFTQLPNAWLRDNELSFKARGLLAMLMSHSTDWSVTIKALAAQGPDGAAAIRTAVQELERRGYLQRVQTRDRRGRLGPVDWRVTDPADRGTSVDTPLLGFPSSENRTTASESDYPSSENRTTIEEQVKEHLSTELKNPTTDARASKKDALTGDSHHDAPVETPAERYRRLLAEKCPRSPSKTHQWEASGYCANCVARLPSTTDLVSAAS